MSALIRYSQNSNTDIYIKFIFLCGVLCIPHNPGCTFFLKVACVVILLMKIKRSLRIKTQSYIDLEKKDKCHSLILDCLSSNALIAGKL